MGPVVTGLCEKTVVEHVGEGGGIDACLSEDTRSRTRAEGNLAAGRGP